MQKPDLQFDEAGALESAVGARDGLTKPEWAALRRETAAIVRRLNRSRTATPYRDLPRRDDLTERRRIKRFAKAGRGRFDDLVVLGIGGSALGLTALRTALCPPFWNHLPAHRRKGRPRLWVMDNVDPAEFAALFDLVEPKRTLFNVISKSGETAETMAQLLVALEVLRECLGRAWKRHLVVTTDARTGVLREFVRATGRGTARPVESFTVPGGVGGRFSVFSPVGLVGAAMLGINIDGLLRGAAAMDKRCCETRFAANPAARGAAVQVGLYRKGKRLSVMMPYSAALRDVADWYRQLWAESLGKEKRVGRRVLHVGPTPIKALGVTDQHSQVQLYREGPSDKVLTILSVEDYGAKVPIPEAPAGLAGVEYLEGRSLRQLFQAEERATAWALAAVSKRPTVRIVLPRVTPYTVGQLLQMLMVETSIAGEMLGLGERTYLQPGVEAGKEATRALMGKTGTLDPAKSGLPRDITLYPTLRQRIETSGP
jgi:glucose-6-phosphate isomerase